MHTEKGENNDCPIRQCLLKTIYYIESDNNTCMNEHQNDVHHAVQ